MGTSLFRTGERTCPLSSTQEREKCGHTSCPLTSLRGGGRCSDCQDRERPLSTLSRHGKVIGAEFDYKGSLQFKCVNPRADSQSIFITSSSPDQQSEERQAMNRCGWSSPGKLM